MKHLLPTAAFGSLCLMLTACTPGEKIESAPDMPASTEARQLRIKDMSAFFDCVREERGVLIAAHRGGPVAGYPENALETLANTLASGVPVMEIDVAESQDGVLFLMHDRSLSRTAGLQQAVAATDWSEVTQLKLSDNDGHVTGYSPPAFTDVLDWAVASGALLELDRKPTTSFRNIIAAVREAGAENNVILISYNENEALTVQRLAPDLMFTGSAHGRSDVRALEDKGIDPTKLIAWTGTKFTNPRDWHDMAGIGVESAFGTLGRPGERLDDEFWADGDGREYAALVEDGLVLLATDEPFRVADTLTADDRALAACGQ